MVVPFVKNNVDLCLFNLDPEDLLKSRFSIAASYIALGELKGGIDPAGANEHWKTARTSLERINEAFKVSGYSPNTFFIGAAIEKKMASQIWDELESNSLANAANLNEDFQIASISNWLCMM